jgi:very-short-patch-repair endonuclease
VSRLSVTSPSPLGRGREAQSAGRVRVTKLRTYHDQPSGTVSRARELRKNATDAEKRLWRGLRDVFPAAKFRRQVPVGPYYADFYSFSAKLIIEVDGGQHAEAASYDEARTRFLQAQGFMVLRFWNNEVIETLEGVLNIISESLSPSPSHR